MNEDKLLAETQTIPAAGGPPAGAFPADQARLQADMQEFAELFPELAKDPRGIPQEVWAQVRQGRSLLGAYIRCLLARQGGGEARRQEMDRWNAGTAARSTGSMRSAESGLSGRDAFLQGFSD